MSRSSGVVSIGLRRVVCTMFWRLCGRHRIVVCRFIARLFCGASSAYFCWFVSHFSLRLTLKCCFNAPTCLCNAPTFVALRICLRRRPTLRRPCARATTTATHRATSRAFDAALYIFTACLGAPLCKHAKLPLRVERQCMRRRGGGAFFFVDLSLVVARI